MRVFVENVAKVILLCQIDSASLRLFMEKWPIFAEDRRHLSKTFHASMKVLRSICTIFALAIRRLIGIKY